MLGTAAWTHEPIERLLTDSGSQAVLEVKRLHALLTQDLYRPPCL